ncbi:MAG TPA: hypothetical protein VE011_10830 [Candidatus Dormibacteraeota bacterium]|nr:hypothetical protein [Candidatus Dormibacteraeota bacterium]
MTGASWTIGIEAETHVQDLQALERRVALKLRDGEVTAVVLVLSDTRHHRELLGGLGSSLLTAFPTGSRAALRMLHGGIAPGTNSIVLV